MICKQLNEIKVLVSIDKSQELKANELGIPLNPIISSIEIRSINKRCGPYGIFLDVAGEEIALGRQRGGIREFGSVESAIKTCRTAGLKKFNVEFSDIEMLRQSFGKEEDREED
jgi:hypothetical protein